jgi:IPT/TIG domain/PASTA domain
VKLMHRSLPVAAVVAALLSFCASAGAANFVIGPTLTGTGWISEKCELASCTVANYELGGTGPTLTSPVDGAVVSFSVLGGSTPGTYRLRTVKPGESSVSWFFGKEAAAVAVVPNPGVQAYPALLPIKAGETIGLSMNETASLAFKEGIGRASFWEIEPPESGHSLGSSFPEVWAFNAEVQPAPTVAGLGAASGPTAGGTVVPITGTEFVNVTGVAFGSTPATSFSVTSEGALTAVAPASAAAGAVPVKVTTVAGSATAPQTFTYEAPPVLPPPVVQCVVPNLKGKTLKAAKTALERAKCKLGAVTKLGGATLKSGKVSKQGAKPGAKVVVGTKVAVTLKSPTPPKPAHKKGKKGSKRP